MALESAAQFIDDLVETNPAAGDPIAQGDDHIRLLKAILRRCFPGLDEALLDASGNVLASKLGNVPAVPTELVDDVITPAMLDADTAAKKLAMRERIAVPAAPTDTRVFNANITFASSDTWSGEQTASAALTGRLLVIFVWENPEDTNDAKYILTVPGGSWDAAGNVGSGTITTSDGAYAISFGVSSTLFVGKGSGSTKFRTGSIDVGTNPTPLQVYVV